MTIDLAQTAPKSPVNPGKTFATTGRKGKFATLAVVVFVDTKHKLAAYL